MSWRWVAKETALIIHAKQLAEHGGLPGVRDMNLLESALARPLNLAAYLEPSVFDLAASYAFGIAQGSLSEQELSGWFSKETRKAP